MTSSNGNIFRFTAICAGNSPVPGQFPAQRPVKRSFDVFFDLRLNKRLSKQSWGWWFETLSCPLWRHCNVVRALLWFVTGRFYPKLWWLLHKHPGTVSMSVKHPWRIWLNKSREFVGNSWYNHNETNYNQSACTFWWISNRLSFIKRYDVLMMTSSHGSFFRVTGPLFGNSLISGEFPSQRASNAYLDVLLVWLHIIC